MLTILDPLPGMLPAAVSVYDLRVTGIPGPPVTELVQGNCVVVSLGRGGDGLGPGDARNVLGYVINNVMRTRSQTIGFLAGQGYGPGEGEAFLSNLPVCVAPLAPKGKGGLLGHGTFSSLGDINVLQASVDLLNYVPAGIGMFEGDSVEERIVLRVVSSTVDTALLVVRETPLGSTTLPVPANALSGPALFECLFTTTYDAGRSFAWGRVLGIDNAVPSPQPIGYAAADGGEHIASLGDPVTVRVTDALGAVTYQVQSLRAVQRRYAP